MPCPLLIFSQSNCLIQIVTINSNTKWQTVQIQISWLLQINNKKKKKKKKKKEAINNTQIRRRCMRHLIRMYTVWEFIYGIWGRQTVLIETKRKRKKTGAFKRCILLSLSVKRPLIFWTRRLHLDVLQSQCIHTCHTNGLIIRLPLLMIRVNRLFTAQRSVKCWFFDNVWIMT